MQCNLYNVTWYNSVRSIIQRNDCHAVASANATRGTLRPCEIQPHAKGVMKARFHLPLPQRFCSPSLIRLMFVNKKPWCVNWTLSLWRIDSEDHGEKGKLLAMVGGFGWSRGRSKAALALLWKGQRNLCKKCLNRPSEEMNLGNVLLLSQMQNPLLLFVFQR